MNTKTFLAVGIDRDDGIRRLLGNSEAYDELLMDYAEDTDFSTAKTAFEAHDEKSLYIALHSMKGVAGNLSLTSIYVQTSKLCDKLKKNQTEGIAEDFYLLEEMHKRAVAQIKKQLGGSEND